MKAVCVDGAWQPCNKTADATAAILIVQALIVQQRCNHIMSSHKMFHVESADGDTTYGCY